MLVTSLRTTNRNASSKLFVPPTLLSSLPIFGFILLVLLRSVGGTQAGCVSVRQNHKRQKNLSLIFFACSTLRVNPIVSDGFLCVFGKTD